VADYILYGLEKVKVSIADVQDRAVKRKLKKVRDLNKKNVIHNYYYYYYYANTASGY
jgi:hypothetical protein